MRLTKKSLLLLGLTISISSFSQFSAGPEIGLALSNSSDIGTSGLGGSLRYEAVINNKLSWTCSIGYMSFFEVFHDEFPTSNKIVSMSGGTKYYFFKPGKGFYAAADLGLNFISYAAGTYNPGSAFTAPSYDFFSANDKRLSLSPSLGYRTNRWDLSGKFNAISNANYFSLRAAYVFHLK